MQTMHRQVLAFMLLIGVLASNAHADIHQECALHEPKIQAVCEKEQDKQAAVTLNKLMLYSLSHPRSQEEFESAVKWKNSWRGIVNQCLQFKSQSEYGNCMAVNMQRFTRIFMSQYPKADLQADSEKLRIQALDRIKLLITESKKRSDECLEEAIRKSDNRSSAPIEAGRTAFTNCRAKIHTYMRLASDTYVIDDFLLPSSLTTEESLADTEEHIYSNDMLSQLVIDARAKSPRNTKADTTKSNTKPIKTKPVKDKRPVQ